MVFRIECIDSNVQSILANNEVNNSVFYLGYHYDNGEYTCIRVDHYSSDASVNDEFDAEAN